MKVKTKKNRSLFYRISAWLHLWLGLVTGIVVIIVSITGAALVFEQELRVLLDPYQTVEANNRNFLPPSVLKHAAMKKYNLPAVSAVVYQGKNRSAVVPYYGDRSKYQLIYIDPYSAEILHYQLLSKDFFRIMLEGHYNLWLPRKFGKPIVAYSTLIFVITLVTGIVLWWPKNLNKTNVQKSFKIKWTAKWKRINYDLHNVVGFYSLLFALILGLTGMVYGMKWFSDAMYWTASGGKSFAYNKMASDTTLVRSGIMEDEDVLFKQLVNKKADIDNQFLTIGYPFGKAGVWNISLNPRADSRMRDSSESFEQVSLKKLEKPVENGGDLLLGLNYDLHVGSVGGFTTKIIAFLVCIICASLPVTGFIIWWPKK